MKKLLAFGFCMILALAMAFTASAAPPTPDGATAKYEFKVNAAKAGVTVTGVLLSTYSLNGSDHFILKTSEGVSDVTILEKQVFLLAKAKEVLVLPNCRELPIKSNRQDKVKPISKVILGYTLTALHQYRC